MSEHTIVLSEQTYQALLEVARKQGLTPEDWISSQVSQSQPEAKSLYEKTRDLIGAIDSSVESRHQFESTDFGEQIANKLSQQGLRRGCISKM